MSHEFESGLFFEQGAWHGLGVTLDADSPVRRNAADAIATAGMDWGVATHPIYDHNRNVIDSHKAVIRDSDQKVLGVVKNRYRCLQNREIFNWFQPFIDEGGCQFETCGSLKGGSVVWVLATLAMNDLEVGQDKIKPYLQFSSSHDGSQVTRIGFVPIRTVCWNTLSANLCNKESQLLRIPHTESQHVALHKVRDIINLATQTFEATVEDCRKLVACKVNREDVREYVRVVFEFADDEKISTRSANVLKHVTDLCYVGVGNSGETAWDAYNGVTQYLTHEAGRSADTRLQSLWFGENKDRTDRALRLALELVK